MSRNKKHWTTLETRELFKSPFFRLRSEKIELPDKRIFPNYYTIDFTDWVNVVPITTSGEIVLISQYRHPVGETLVEIPGGAIDPRSKETPAEAAVRELAEETGYVPKDLKLVGTHIPNPALQSNKLWTFVATGCEKKLEQNLDEFEDIEVFTASKDKTYKMITGGEITHSLIIASLHLAMAHI